LKINTKEILLAFEENYGYLKKFGLEIGGVAEIMETLVIK